MTRFFLRFFFFIACQDLRDFPYDIIPVSPAHISFTIIVTKIVGVQYPLAFIMKIIKIKYKSAFLFMEGIWNRTPFPSIYALIYGTRSFVFALKITRYCKGNPHAVILAPPIFHAINHVDDVKHISLRLVACSPGLWRSNTWFKI